MSDKALKRFLFVTYYYPPAGGPAVQRIIRIIQYLAEHGWQGVVLTVKKGEYTSLDPQLEREIPPGTKVIRTSLFEPYRFYRQLIGKKSSERIPLAVLSSHQQAGWKEKLANHIRANLFIPDARIGWYRQGVRAGVNAIQNDSNIKLIFSSGPPHTVHLIARAIAKKTGKPFIADFRDPWLNIDYYHNMKRSSLTIAVDKYLERKVLTTADELITVSPGCRDLLVDHHNHIDLDRFHIIYNGYDPGVYPEKNPLLSRNKFVMTYIGNLPLTRFTPNLYQAIAELKQEGKLNPDRFQLNFYGNIDASSRNEISQFQIDDLLNFHDFIPHQQAILKICQSNMVLLVINNTHTKKAIVTGKLFEYLGSQRPVLCIGPPDGDAAKILDETGGGVCFDYDDVNGVKQLMAEQFHLWETGKWKPVSNSAIEKYKRSNQLAKLTSIFNSVSERRSNEGDNKN